MPVRFYDVGQANAALIDLPDGRAVLVDAGGDPRQLVPKIRADLGDRPLALVWITHPHADHLGAAKTILKHFPVAVYVDNGRDVGTRRWWWSRSPASAARKEAARRGVHVATVSPKTPDVPLNANGTALRFSAVVPREWPRSCVEGNANNCSVGLRMDYCDSSVLFLGDAEAEEQRAFAAIRLRPCSSYRTTGATRRRRRRPSKRSGRATRSFPGRNSAGTATRPQVPFGG
jgi:competence protein ComEC